MNPAFNLITDNLELSIETIVLMLVLIGGVIFYAKDYRIGLIIQFLGTGGLFMWLYSAGLNYAPSLIAFFVVLVIMVLALYGQGKENPYSFLG